jgi:hypothetical protein
MQQYNIVTNVNLGNYFLLSGALICHLIYGREIITPQYDHFKDIKLKQLENSK